ncbi:sarcosine oxidase subunit delta [Lutibaculum baratangense]|uniref:Sarcosine oxidase delta subunit n=1 Tax=Lutibaculum baratangense AMV1 TaxID=631454 RepID=V4RBP8_9HYPH|nr:sarcosine oxidase subunit delta [Lutibaculum baratangense]ESR22829.1 Sarcosine oxidase delta subunit [Lutibaculum baratangense AMV1]
MFVITCPYCGERDQAEFVSGGQAHRTRPLNAHEMSDADWGDWVFMRDNPKGIFAERWFHSAGCRRWFNALRNTATDQFLAFYPMGEAPPAVEAVLPATPAGEAPIGSGNDAVKVMRPGESEGTTT